MLMVVMVVVVVAAVAASVLGAAEAGDSCSCHGCSVKGQSPPSPTVANTGGMCQSPDIESGPDMDRSATMESTSSHPREKASYLRDVRFCRPHAAQVAQMYHVRPAGPFCSLLHGLGGASGTVRFCVYFFLTLVRFCLLSSFEVCIQFDWRLWNHFSAFGMDSAGKPVVRLSPLYCFFPPVLSPGQRLASSALQ